MSCRLEFDAYRADLEELNMGPRDAVTMARIEAAQQQYQIHKDKYERLRNDVTIKLKFLEENKVTNHSHNFLFKSLKQPLIYLLSLSWNLTWCVCVYVYLSHR